MHHVISILAEDKPGVLVRITGAVSARGDNITRLSANPDARSGFARITFSVDTEPARIDLLCRKLQRLIQVVSVRAEAADAMIAALTLPQPHGRSINHGRQIPLSLD
jgi:acetolactate synthase small subunit